MSLHKPGALFFYGVLMPELASGRMAELVALLEPGVAATTAGVLFAVADPLGHHPAIVAGQGTVHGRVHRLGPRFGGAELAEMDRYEGDLYARRETVARLDDGSPIACDAYLWLGAKAGLERIEHGDFVRYLRESGAPALPG